MTPDEIAQELEAYIVSVMTGTDYAGIVGYTFEGVPMETEPTPSDYWVRFSIRLLNTEPVEIGEKGSGAIGIRWGNLHINTFSPTENGKRQGETYAGLFEAEFRRLTTTNLNFIEPSTNFIPAEDWLNHHTVIQFFSSIGEI